jgi:hypothetical protein
MRSLKGIHESRIFDVSGKALHFDFFAHHFCVQLYQ